MIQKLFISRDITICYITEQSHGFSRKYEIEKGLSNTPRGFLPQTGSPTGRTRSLVDHVELQGRGSSHLPSSALTHREGTRAPLAPQPLTPMLRTEPNTERVRIIANGFRCLGKMLLCCMIKVRCRFLARAQDFSAISVLKDLSGTQAYCVRLRRFQIVSIGNHLRLENPRNPVAASKFTERGTVECCVMSVLGWHRL